MPFTNTVLITSAPNFLNSFRTVREWLYPCGSTRAAVFYPRRKDNDDEPQPVPKKVTVLVTFGHPDAAVKFLASFKEFSSRLDERYNQMDAYMVPNSPEIPLPPPVADRETTTVLGEKLWQNFVGIEAASEEEDRNVDQNPYNNSISSVNDNKREGDENKLDAHKVAAAAGGAYDLEDDPLNAPHVLEAVKAFRRNLEKTQTFQQKRRIELVQQKMKDMRPRIEAQMMEDRKRRKQSQEQERHGPPPPLPLPPPGTSLPPPPLPMGLPPPPGGVALPIPPAAAAAAAAAADSGKRGRSNLPAWMTQQATTTSDQGPATKKSKTYPTNFPATLAPSTHAILRDFLTNQVRESLGEEETTLIDFLYNHILQGKPTSELLQELQVVLEEESEGFLQAVWAKIDELAKV
jgi:hypothetical protein